MREGWRTVALGSVFTPSSLRVGVGTNEPPVLSVTKHNGVVLASEYFDRRVASESLASYKVLKPQDWAYSTIHIDEGSIAKNNLGLEGAVSPMYTTMSFCGGDHEPSYFELLLRAPEMLRRFSSAQQGSINRRRSLPWKGFVSLEVNVPSLLEQRRIVDLISAVDNAITDSMLVIARTGELAAFLRRDVPAGDDLALGEVIKTIESGTSTKPIVGPGPRVHVLSLASVRPARFHAGEIKDVGPATLPEKARLREGDLLITRSNTPDRVGYVCVAREVPDSTYLPDLIWRLVPDERQVSRDYLEQVLSSPQLRAAISGSAGGTSESMRKINKAGFARLRIPVPDRVSQDAYTGPLRVLCKTQRTQEGAVAALQAVRSQLLTTLLSGEHEVPESYDELMEVAS